MQGGGQSCPPEIMSNNIFLLSYVFDEDFFVKLKYLPSSVFTRLVNTYYKVTTKPFGFSSWMKEDQAENLLTILSSSPPQCMKPQPTAVSGKATLTWIVRILLSHS